MSRHSRNLVVAETALGLVTAAAVVGMHRLFIDGSYRPALLLQVALAHVTVSLLRRRGVRLVPAALATAAVAVVALSWTHYAGATTWLVPTGETWAAASDDLRSAWHVSRDMEAPVPVETGFLVAGGAALWLMAFIADWAAFRAAATFEALLPSSTLFLFAAALGAAGGRVAGATVFAAAAMAFVLLQRTLSQEESSSWAGSQRVRGRWSLLGTGAVLIGVAATAGAVTGPNLPGSGADAVWTLRDINDDEDDTRVVISPMVDLQTRLVDQPDVELFTVRSSVGTYWRLTSLDEFDGQIWRSSYGTSDARGSLPRAFESQAESDVVRQTFSVSNLAAVWLPAAWEPVAIEPGDNQVDWDEPSSTLIVDKELDSSDGFTYEVDSLVPQWSADELRTASAEVPADVAERYLQLPEVDERVEQLARDVTADAPTRYDEALALQNYLRGADYTYNLGAGDGHSSDALASFLFETREGYCEQFAGAFAVLARTIGLPSRVSVGFTKGIQNPDDPTLFHVRGKHAHAWVEVYLDGFGWVILDPTPERGPPGADRWLGVGEQQDAPEADGAAVTTAPTTPGAPAEPSPDADGPPAALEPGDGSAAVVDAQKDDRWIDVPESVGVGVRAVSVAALAYLVLVPAAIGGLVALRRRQRHMRADRVRAAWRDALDRAATAGVALPPSLTVNETAERLAAALPGAAASVHQLATTVEHVTYAEVPPSAEMAARALEARDAIVGEVRHREPAGSRLARYLDARELWRRLPHRVRRSARTTPPSVFRP